MFSFFYFIPTTPSSTSFPLGICLFLHVWSFLFPPHWLSVDKEKGKTTVVPKHSFMPYVGWQFAYAGPFPKICVRINKN